MFGGKSIPIVGEKGVQYGLQARKGADAAPKKQSLAMFGGSDDEEEIAPDRNAAIRAQQGTKRSDAKVWDLRMMFTAPGVLQALSCCVCFPAREGCRLYL